VQLDGSLTVQDLQHHIHLLANNGKLATAPFDPDFKIHRVLDVGTGTGIWAIDFGKSGICNCFEPQADKE
jgi:ribosomal protein L11 methylase PrmA